MTKRPPKYLQDLIEEMRPQMARAFREVVRDQVNATNIGRLTRAIERGDIDAVYRALNLTPEFYGPLTEAMRSAYGAGGSGALTALGQGVGGAAIRFTLATPEAVSWLSGQSGRMIADIDTGQREAVQSILSQGRIDGRGAKAMALDIAGRMDGGVRKGGVVGLNGPQARAVEAARADLRDLSARYFTRTKRDKRFDSAVKKAIKSGKPLNKSQIAKIAGRYADRLLKLRGDNIARTETVAALNAGRIDAIRQLIARGDIDAQDASKIWHQSGKADPRHWHISMEGQRVGIDGHFMTQKGNMLKFPCDPDAPAIEAVSCGCYMEIKIDYIGRLGRKVSKGV